MFTYKALRERRYFKNCVTTFIHLYCVLEAIYHTMKQRWIRIVTEVVRYVTRELCGRNVCGSSISSYILGCLINAKL